ncbi:MAG TPA: COX15/CtaA family protein [Solirubrobacteraceae bacterium]|jgi:cytochrome c oxidase assembly protein subunit 15|nr:COX15/CtaA family protein [Solirubrobacteraceae bacterium]
MASLRERVRGRTNGYTVTPARYVWFAWVALGALTLIVLTGAAVRLTGSGLGCPDWPRCYGRAYPPLNTHSVIEFSNRLLTGPVSIAALGAWVAALRRRPRRRDLVWLSGALPLGVLGQAVLGGFTVRGALDYGWVMGHFALSMAILAAGVALVWRASREPDSEGGALPSESVDRALVIGTRVLVFVGGLTIFAGTAATAAGPHAGGAPGQRINRLDLEGRGTMDFVIHRHGEIALAFGLLALGLWWLTRGTPRKTAAGGATAGGAASGVAGSDGATSDNAAPGGARAGLHRALTALCALLALQGAVGLDQYKTHLPTGLVWVHVALATVSWLAVLWAGCAAGRLPAREASRPTDPSERPLSAAAPEAAGTRGEPTLRV